MSDPAQAVGRYQQYLATLKADDPNLAPAKLDLATWQDRVDRKLVKLGNDWVTADQKAAVVAGAGKQVGDGKRSLAYAMRFRAPDRTLTRDEATTARDAAVALAAQKLGAALRA